MSKPRLLWVGDAACPSGFARVTHNICDRLTEVFDITILGINYRGDPQKNPDGSPRYEYDIYAAAVTGDAFGVARLLWMCDLVKPDVIVIQNDPWNFEMYFEQLQSSEEYKSVPVVGVVAVDGKNCGFGQTLNRLALGIFWTQFGLDEARAGGFTQPGIVLPLGVDRRVFMPGDMIEARERQHFPNHGFIVGNVNRNQPRKRWDLTLKFFAEWVQSYDVHDALLFLYVAPTGDTGIKIGQLAKYYGVVDRLKIAAPPTFYGIDDTQLSNVYRCFDVQVNTGNEGFGLTTLEGMACGTPNIGPSWSALGEWPGDAMVQIPCSTTLIGPPYMNVIQGVPDEAPYVEALHRLYSDARFYAQQRKRGLARAAEPRFDWDVIAQGYRHALMQVLASSAPAPAATVEAEVSA